MVQRLGRCLLKSPQVTLKHAVKGEGHRKEALVGSSGPVHCLPGGSPFPVSTESCILSSVSCLEGVCLLKSGSEV